MRRKSARPRRRPRTALWSISVRLMRETWRRIRSGQGHFPGSRWRDTASQSLRTCSARSIWMKRQSVGWGLRWALSLWENAKRSGCSGIPSPKAWPMKLKRPGNCARRSGILQMTCGRRRKWQDEDRVWKFPHGEEMEK